MIQVTLPRATEHAGKPRPRIRRAHVNDSNRLDLRPRWVDSKEARGFTIFDAAPKLLFCSQQEMLVKGIGRDGDLDPFPTAGDYREHRDLGIDDPHIVLK